MKKFLAVLALISTSVMATNNSKWDKVFPQSDKVIVESVTFKNRFNITIAADMYLPKDIDRSQKHAALIVGHPYGSIKEQSSGLYAQQMAERGYVTLAFDNSFAGESGGEPHHISSPEIYAEDFSAAVDFIGTRPFVDRNRIGVIGICGSGGFAISAAQVDPRMKAIATVSMYDIGTASRQGLSATPDRAQIAKTLEAISEQRWTDYEKGTLTMRPGVPETLTKDSNAVEREFYDYYRTPRGQHPRATTDMSVTSGAAQMNFYPFDHIDIISPRPLLFIAGEHAHSLIFSEDAYKRAAEPKELYIVKGAGHVDLYDKTNLIPFDKLDTFFKQYLK
ncbi:alpha/beta hydrolase [Yersinia frederiksenii]|uniref:alpha/beta hydrolase n=1 Tax=Yersinia frederiksenii TaxID=29484 RepID=UPI0005DB87B5|nr:alpha/beta hydrolase [Yersinia frederiksenii]CNF45132.1 alpha/beta hydrolase [Yersinia frederiksenii]